jgi:uncharacterized protein (DUF58 family)
MGRIWWLAALSVVVVGAVQTNRLLLLTGLLLALIGAAAWIWARHCLAGVTYRRRFGSTHVFFGEETDLFLEAVNAKPLPLAWLRMSDEFPADVDLLSGTLTRTIDPHRRFLINTVSLRWYEKVTRRYRLRGNRRGVWRFGPASLTSGDIFGLSTKRQLFQETDTLLVYPKMVELAALGLPTLHPFGESNTPQRLVDDPLRMVGARDYLPGDSFRNIHWKASAHRRALQTKLFEPSGSRPLAIFLNIRTSPFIAVDRDLLELAIVVAASVARWGWEEGHAVGLYANSILQPSRERLRLHPATHPDRLNWILDALARVDIIAPWSIATVLQLESSSLPFGSTVVVISGLVDERLERTLLDLRRREHGVTLITLGDAALENTLSGVKTYQIGAAEEWRELETLRLVG